jgi:hypothetical protein
VTAGKWQVSTAGGMFSRWRRDGTELFFHAPDGKLMAVPVKAGSSFEAGIPVTLFDTRDPSIDSIFDVIPDGQPFLISRFRDALPLSSISPKCLTANSLVR